MAARAAAGTLGTVPLPTNDAGLPETVFEQGITPAVVANTASSGNPKDTPQVHIVEDAWNNLHETAITNYFYVGKALTQISSDWSWR